MKKIILFVSALALLASCAEVKKSDDVNTDDIYQRYTCEYNSNGSGTLKAEFISDAKWDRLEEEKSGSSFVNFGDKDVVTCNGIKLKREESKMSGVYYTCNFPAGTKNIEIVFTDKEGKKYTHKAVFYPFELIPNEEKTSNGVKIKWKGEASNTDSRVQVSLTGYDNDITKDKKNKKRTESEFAENAGDSFVEFNKQTLSNFRSTVNVTAERKTIIRLQEVTKAEGTLKITGNGGNFDL